MPPEVPKLAECVADVRALLQHILSDRLPAAQVKSSFSGIAASSSTSALLGNYLQSVLDECHETFLACYHAFYPNSQLKWRGLCDLLLTIDVVSFLFSSIFSLHSFTKNNIEKNIYHNTTDIFNYCIGTDIQLKAKNEIFMFILM